MAILRDFLLVFHMIGRNSILIEKILDSDDLNDNSLLSKKGCVYSFLNPVSYIDALDNVSLFGSLDGIFADGSLLAFAIERAYGHRIKRRSFDMTSLAPALFEYAVAHDKSVYIVASKTEEVEKAVRIFKNRYDNLRIVGYRNGYFKDETDKNTEIARIIALDPDFLIVGMGIITQEEFLLKVKEKGFNGIGFSCGGFIHQTAADKIDYYPPLIDKLNLRFLYRFYMEKHTRRRYLKAIFIFPYRFVKERLSSSKNVTLIPN